jgi:phosphatidylethanolamine/phosphatidyl-N-methylethanolamine N-methyltransferase
MLPRTTWTNNPEVASAGMGYWTECREFFGQFRRQYHTTGSIMPSSRALGRALTRPIRRAHRPRRILEVGPGTGAVTAEIVRSLGPGDQLDIVEINARFVELIERRFAEEPLFRRRRTQARVLHAPLQEVPGAAVYDFMISGLPLNNFALDLVEDIFRSYRRLLKPDGVLSYFEYLAIRALKMPFVAGAERERLEVLGTYLQKQIDTSQIGEEAVFWNVPPAVARHFRFGGAR